MPPRISNLVEAIRELIPRLPAKAPGRVARMPWPRPPLRTDRTLRGLQLDFFAAPRCNLSVSEFRMAYEEFVELSFVQPDPTLDPKEFFQSRLKLQVRMVEWLFPRKAMAYDHLATLLWIAHVSIADSKFEEGPGTCLVTAWDISFGIKDNALVSRFHTLALQPFDYTNSIDTHASRGDQLFNTNGLMIGIYVHARTIKDADDRKNVELALQYMFYRYGNLGRLADYFYRNPLGPRRERGKGLRGTLQIISRNLYVDSNPMPFIYEQLVTRKIIDRSEYKEMFDEDLQALANQPRDLFVEYQDILRISKILKRKKP